MNWQLKSLKCWLVLLVTMGGIDASVLAQSFPSVDVSRPGTGQQRRLHRTLSLLGGSRPDRSNTVRIAYYGQSFVQAGWWTNLVVDLRKSYPFANIIAENRALDRHPSPELIRLAETHLYPFRPDMVVLMASGDHHELRRLVRVIRERTSAEVLLMTEPIRQASELDEPIQSSDFGPDPLHFRPTPKTWHAFLNYGWLPFVADDQDAALVDVRSGWKAYLRENQLEPRALMPDGERFSVQGQFVITRLLRPWFEFPSTLNAEDPWDGERVSTYEIPRDLAWKNGALRLEFEGNRLEVIVRDSFSKPIPVLLDGKAPSEFRELRVHGIAASPASRYPGTDWPVLLRVGNEVQLEREVWTAKLFGISTNGGGLHFKFQIKGSKTGVDGEGSSNIEFLSKSKRISIQPEDWNLELGIRRGVVKLREAFEIQWSELDLGRDNLGGDPETGGPGQKVIPVATGFVPGRHVFEIRDQAGAESGVVGIRVYRPSLKVQPKRKP